MMIVRMIGAYAYNQKDEPITILYTTLLLVYDWYGNQLVAINAIVTVITIY